MGCGISKRMYEYY